MSCRATEIARALACRLGAFQKGTVNSTIDSTIQATENAFMASLTANDLKTRGVAAIEESLAHQPEAVISVRGKDRFVVMEVAQYHYLRECELDAALAQSQADVAAGRYVVESAQQHIARLDALLTPAGASAQGNAKSTRARASARKTTGKSARRPRPAR